MVEMVENITSEPTLGSAGLRTQLPGRMTSVSAVALHSGGIAPGNLIETDK